jgi:hypothetical protein
MPKRKIDGAPDAEQATTMACTLRCFARLRKQDYPEDDRAELRVLVQSAITGLMHFCEENRIDFEGLLISADTEFLDECEDVAA